MEEIESFLQLSKNIPITFFESLLILIFSYLAGFTIRYFFIKYGESMSSKIAFGNSLIMCTISVSGLIAIVKSSLALSLGLVGALSVIRFRTAVKEPYNLSFVLFSISVAIAIGASYFRFAFLLLFVGCLVIYFINQKNNKLFRERNVGELDNINVELPAGSNLEDIYLIFDKFLLSFFIRAISERKDGTISISIRASIPNRNAVEQIRKEIRKKYSENIFTFYGTSL